jgi:hypothetical protein
MTIDDHISKLQTCGKAGGCKFEDSCLEVARYAHKQRGTERLRQAVARVEGVEIPVDDDLVYFQPPNWEWVR